MERKRSRFAAYKLSDLWKRIAFSVVVAIVIPILSSFVGSITSINQIFLGAFVFVIGLLVQLLMDVAQQREESIPIAEFWDVMSETDLKLNEVRNGLARLARAKHSLYVRYFEHQLKEIARGISGAASAGELPVDQNMDTTEFMLRDFHGDDSHRISLIHFLTDNDFMFEVHVSHFFCDVAAGVANNSISGVRRLFIVGDDRELTDERTRKLAAFHEGTQGFEYKVLRRRDFDRIKRDGNLPLDCRDFGVYGEGYVYRSTAAAEGDVKGIFSTNGELIRRFKGVFDRCWTSELAFKLDGLPTVPSLRELFGRDAISPNRPGVRQVLSSATPLQIGEQTPMGVPSEQRRL